MIHGGLWLQRVLEPHSVSVDEDLREGAKEVEVIASVSVCILIFCLGFHARSKHYSHS